MAQNKSESSRNDDGSGSRVTSIAQAREQRRSKTSTAKGRQQPGDKLAQALSPSAESVNSGPSVRPVRVNRPTGRRFDREKVEKIKQQLARGEYRIDPLKVADLFIEHERHG